MSFDCPSKITLHDWVLGNLPDSDADLVIEHLETCVDCDQQVDVIVKQRSLALTSGTKDYRSELECVNMIEALVTSPITIPKQTDSTLPLTRIRDYELTGVLGQGGMGVVYLARHSRLNKDVAIKLLPRYTTRDTQAVRRFEREMRVVGQMEHPNVIRALDAGEINGTWFLVLELIEGGDLSRLIPKGQMLDVDNACEMIRQAAIGLQYAHDQGLVHRDVKPANLMLTSDAAGIPVVKVMDLGLVSSDQDEISDSLTDTGQLMGTLEFMAPEQTTKSTVDYRADIYALGATLFRLLTGTVPFSGEEYNSPAKRLQGLLNHSAPPVENHRPDLPDQLITLIGEMLSTSPENRPQSMDEVAQRLSMFATEHNLNPLLSDAKEISTRQMQPLLTAGGVMFTDTSPTAGPTDVYNNKGEGSEEDQVVSSSPNGNSSKAPSRIVRLILGVTVPLFAILAGIIWLKMTDGSYVRIDTAPSIVVTVEVLKDGKKIDAITINQNKREHWLRTGAYEIRLPASTEETLVVEGNRFTLERNSHHVVSITRVDRIPAKLVEPAKPVRPAVPAIPVDPEHNFALKFNGDPSRPENNRVLVPTLKDTESAQTIEFWTKRDSTLWNAKTFERPPPHRWIVGFDVALRINTHMYGGYAFHYAQDVYIAGGDKSTGVEAPVHLAAVRDPDAGEIRFFINGHLIKRKKASLVVGLDSFGICNPKYQFKGPDKFGGYRGWIDELRISSIARYNDDFQPETRYGTDQHTLALYHFDEGTGTVLKDSSGNNHHGEIRGAKWIHPDPLPVEDNENISIHSDPPVFNGQVDQRAVAEWVLKNKGSVAIGSNRNTCDNLAKLPDGPLQVVSIKVIDVTDAIVEQLTAILVEMPECIRLTLVSDEQRPITDACLTGISCLVQLRNLELYHGAITDDGIMLLKDLPLLQHVRLHNLSVGEASLEYLQQTFPKLGVLGFQQHGHSDVSLAAITKILKLRHFFYGADHLSAATVQNISESSLTQLTLLDIPKLDVENFGTLMSESRLTYLHVDACNFRDEHLVEVRNCLSLKILKLDSVQVTENGLRAFIKHRPNVEVRYDNSPFQSVIDELQQQ